MMHAKQILSFFLCLLSFSLLSGQEMVFNESYKALLDVHNSETGFNYSVVDDKQIEDLDATITAAQNTRAWNLRSKINLYNYLVIRKVLENYPLNSVGELSDFFTKKVTLGDIHVSLNDFERDILDEGQNAFIHLLLNCGARSCPNLRYISQEIPLEEYYEVALQQENIYFKSENQVSLSQIFFWYKDEFSSDQMTKLVGDKKVSYLDYDWLLNDSDARLNDNYYPTKLYSNGGGELKIFNNYYTQSDGGFVSNFFSSFFQFLIGTNKNLNYGFDVKFRSSNQGQIGTFSALAFQNNKIGASEGGEVFARSGISGIGPKIKYQPFKKHNNINFLHTVYFVPLEDAQGNEDYGYSDYNNLQFFNQMFYEKELSVKRRLFLDIGLHIENIKLGVHRNEEHFMPIQIPVTAIYSYFPNTETTIYGLASFGQRIDVRSAPDMDTYGLYSVYGQAGVGFKYFLTDFLEAEILYTNFLDTTPGRSAHTFNLGLRFFKF